MWRLFVAIKTGAACCCRLAPEKGDRKALNIGRLPNRERLAGAGVVGAAVAAAGDEKGACIAGADGANWAELS